MKVLGEVGSIDLMRPEIAEYFIGVKSIFELGIKLMGRSSDSDIAIKSNEPISQISMSH